MRNPMGALVASAIALGGCRAAARPERQADGPARPVDVTRLSHEGAGVGVYRAPGSVDPLERATLATRMMARIETISVRVGDRVTRGRVLATFERGAVAAAGSRAEAELTLATQQLRRMERLYADSAVPVAQLEAARAHWQQAQSQTGAVAAELGYASLVAPFDGIVTGRFADPGALAAPGQPILQVEGSRGREIVVGVPTAIADGLSMGGPITVWIGVEERPITARLAAIVRSADPVTRTVTVRLTTDLPLTANLTAVAELPLPGTTTAPLRVPQTALFERGELSGVFLVAADSVARLRWIRAGRTVGTEREVLAGLREGDLVIRRADQVVDGDRVIPTIRAEGSSR